SQFCQGQVQGTQVERDRRNYRTRQRSSANLRFAFAYGRFHRQRSERKFDLAGASAEFAVRNLKHRQGGDRIGRPVAEVEINGRLHRREDQLIAAQRAEKRLAFERGYPPGFPGNNSRLRTAQQFVATETDEINAALQRFIRRGLVLEVGQLFRFHQSPAAEVFDQRHAFLFGEGGDFLGGGRLHE